MSVSPFDSKSKCFFAALLASITLSACATSSDRRGPPPEDRRAGQQARSSGTFLHPIAALFVGFDTDRNGQTSSAELADGITMEWAAFNGNPSAVAFAPWMVRTLGSTDAMPNFMTFDRNFNGVVSEDEFAEGLQKEFARLDKNGDSAVTPAEMIVSYAAPQGRQRSGSGGQERGREGGGRGGRPQR